jgi:hypothetical protein
MIVAGPVSPLQQLLLSQQYGHLVVVLRRARFLQPVDLPLQIRAFAVVPELFERSNTIGRIGRSPRLAGDVLDEGGFPLT